MKAGYLSEYFAGVALRRLRAVEADSTRSNQHEFNGVNELVRLFGRAQERRVFSAKFLYLSDDQDQPLTEEAQVTWYDARRKHPTRSEHRLYYPATPVSRQAVEGDLLVIGRLRDDSVLVLIARRGSTIENQVQWLFSAEPPLYAGFAVREELDTEADRIWFASALILEQIGIVFDATEERYLDAMLSKFGGTFPTTRAFSAFARSTLPEVDPVADADAALMCWMEREEILFRTLERHLIADRLERGFCGDVEGFLRFSLSVQNRRKSRVGLALENHVEAIFQLHGIRYERTVRTEGRAKPDFLFPSGREYHDPAFPAEQLRMLGVKSTCKERWRQVLAEARRIEVKHLLTLETAISRDQLCQMREHRVQLVVPQKLHGTYPAEHAAWLMNLRDFQALLRGTASLEMRPFVDSVRAAGTIIKTY